MSRHFLFILILASCAGTPNISSVKSSYDPSTAEVVESTDTDEASLITDKFYGDRFKDEFGFYARELCTKKSIKDKSCSKNYDKMIIAKIKLEYTEADWDHINLFCEANPIECRDPVDFEQVVLSSHNQAVDKINEANRKKAIAAQKERDIDHRRKVAGIFQAIADGTKPHQCNSVPNGIGGFRTSCN